jgi:hypothetical protein
MGVVFAGLLQGEISRFIGPLSRVSLIYDRSYILIILLIDWLSSLISRETKKKYILSIYIMWKKCHVIKQSLKLNRKDYTHFCYRNILQTHSYHVINAISFVINSGHMTCLGEYKRIKKKYQIVLRILYHIGVSMFMNMSLTQQVGGFLRVLRFPLPMKLTTRYKWNIVKSAVKHHL